MRVPGSRRALGALVVALVIGLQLVGVAAAAPPTGVLPDWTVTGANPSWTGTVGFTGVSNFPTATFVINSNTPTVPSGASAFLNAGTPFGARFGSTQNRAYLSARAAAGNTPSTTTFTFATPTPAAGGAFTFGDIDADQVTISATGADGAALPTDALGHQGQFNYCQGSPLPSSCGGAQADVPTCDPATATLKGNVADTSGAAGWFAPTAAIKTLTVVFTPLSGIPLYQLWLATETVTLSGTVVAPTGPGGMPEPAPGVTVSLEDPDGVPVPATGGGAVSAVTDTDGTFVLPDVVSGVYDVVVEPPPGYEPAAVTVDATAGDVEGIAVALVATPTPDRPPPATPLPTVTPRFTG